jgi:hypothetical protein
METLTRTGRVPRIANSTDATRGQPLPQRVKARLGELERALDALPPDELRERDDLELAIATADGLMTGDLDNLSDVVANDLNRWLERNKHLAEAARN